LSSSDLRREHWTTTKSRSTSTPRRSPHGNRRIAWQYAVERLAARADAVCMDLRGFSHRNLGCVFELGVLVKSVAFRKVLLLVDVTTDIRALADILQTAWRDAPGGGANDGVAQPAIQAISVQGWSEGQRELLEVLAIRGCGRRGRDIGRTRPGASVQP
jgi:hypothetical protein